MDWKTTANTKRQAISNAIPSEWRLQEIPQAEKLKDVTGEYVHRLLSSEEVEITETDAVSIADKVGRGLWSAVEVTKAFCHRAAIAHQLLNCLHEIFFDAALADAAALDEYYAQHQKPIGPLHGVPVSLKDQFHVKGVETTMGYVGWINTFEGVKDDPRKGVVESEMVRELRNLGAILYCKTSVPHTLMAGETTNNIIGYTLNPKNRHLSCGGSSGGEGALIGIRGSPVGFGTDIGGSIRIPAAFNGLYAIRPSSGRLPYEGMANSMDGQNTTLSVVGPLATTAASVRFVVKALLSTSPWLSDPLVIPLPWRDAEEDAIWNIVRGASEKKLSFGLWSNDGIVTPQPPVARAVKMVAEALQRAGHNVIQWDPPNHQSGLDLTFKSWQYDGGRDVHESFALSGEPVAPQIEMLYGSASTDEMTASQIAANNVARRQWQKSYLDYWNSTSTATGTNRPVDGVITPLAPFAAALPGTFRYLCYSVFVNSLDYTAVTIPVTNADKTIDLYPTNFEPQSDEDKRLREEYDAEIYDGAHVGVQIVGRRLEEEKMLAIAEYVGSLLGK